MPIARTLRLVAPALCVAWWGCVGGQTGTPSSVAGCWAIAGKVYEQGHAVLPDRVLLTLENGAVVSCFVGPDADAGFGCPAGSGAATLSAFVGDRRRQVEVDLDARDDDGCTTEVVNVTFD